MLERVKWYAFRLRTAERADHAPLPHALADRYGVTDAGSPLNPQPRLYVLYNLHVMASGYFGTPTCLEKFEVIGGVEMEDLFTA